MFAAPRVFVSYAREDGEELAVSLVACIERAGVAVWRDREGLRGGEGWWRQIESVLGVVDFVVVVMTPGAIRSPIVRKEWDCARRNGVCVFPVLGSDALSWDEMPGWMRRGHIYDLKFQEAKFLNDLDTRCEKVRVPFMAEGLPPNFVPRPELHERLMAMLLDEEQSTPKAITTALRGAGGFGKTTLARAICHDIRTRYVFDDGILWVTLGQQPLNVAAKLHDLIYTLTRERAGFNDAATASVRLRELLEEKHVLIVIDDIWRESDALPFLVGGRHCTWLLTTRNRGVLPSDAEEVLVDQMRAEEALQLIGSGLNVEPERDALALLAARLREWPLLLNLVNRVLTDRVHRRGEPLWNAIAEANRKLDAQGLRAFDRRHAAARDQAVAKTIGVSLEILVQSMPSTDALARFEELAVFPEDVLIPIAAVAALWEDFDLARELCDHLFNLSLLLTYDLKEQTIQLHDVVGAYLRERIGPERERALHIRLVEAYRRQCADDWQHLRDDGYIARELAHHFACARLHDELYQLIDRSWRDAQLGRFGSDRAFSADVDAAVNAAAENDDVGPLIRCCYVYALLAARATRLAPNALAAMAALGDEGRAAGYAALIDEASQRSRAFRMIGDALLARGEAGAARRAFASAENAAAMVERDALAAEVLSDLAISLGGIDRTRAAEIAKRAADAALETNAKDEMKWPNLLRAAEALLAAGEREAAAGKAFDVQHHAWTFSLQEFEEVRRIGWLLDAAQILKRTGAPWAADAKKRGFARFRELDDVIGDGDYVVLGDVTPLIRHLLAEGNVTAARKVAERWPDLTRWTRAESYAIYAAHLLASGEPAAAASYTDDILDYLERSPLIDDSLMFSFETPRPAIQTFMALLVALGRTPEAMEFAGRIRSAEWRGEAYGAIAHAVAATSAADARTAIECSLQAATIVPTLSPSYVRMMTAVLQAMTRRGMTERARQIGIHFDRSSRRHQVDFDYEWNDAAVTFATARSSIDPGALWRLGPLPEVYLDGTRPICSGEAAAAAYNARTFIEARFDGRDAVLEVLANSARAIDAIDGGETLWRAYEEIIEADAWLMAH